MDTATANLYDTDFYGWVQSQLEALRSGEIDNLDLDNLIEEVESMGRSEQRALESRLEVLLAHLLKWRFQPSRRGASWELTIEEQRRRLSDRLKQNPSLKSKLPDVQKVAYRYAIFRAVKETGMDRSAFPVQCPWTFEQITDPNFWPDA